jgi:putative membrane protein
MLQQTQTFLIRVFANSLALWAAAQLSIVSYGDSFIFLIIAAVMISVLNAIIKPLLVIFTLPAIVLTLGFFTIIINGFIVILTSWLFNKFVIESFWQAVIVGLLIGLLNYIVTLLMAKVGKENG